jgi:hypothetical protein
MILRCQLARNCDMILVGLVCQLTRIVTGQEANQLSQKRRVNSGDWEIDVAVIDGKMIAGGCLRSTLQRHSPNQSRECRIVTTLLGIRRWE